jgi:ribose transport system substrate-binding protein
MFIRRVAKVATVVVTCGLLAACGSDDESEGTASSGEEKKLKIGAVLQTGASPGQQEFLGGLQDGAKKYGYEVKVADAQADAAKANDLVQSFVNQKVDAINIQVIDPAALKAGLSAANAAKIPVYLYYAYGEPEGVAAVTSLNAATAQTERLVADMGDKGSVLAFTFRIGQPCVYAEKDFDKVMAANPGIEVKKQEVAAPGWEKDGATATQAWLKSHPEGSGPLAAWGCWDGPAVGAASALREAGRTDVKVYGGFAEPGGLKAVQDGLFTATYWFDNRAEGVKMLDLIHSDSQKGSITPTYSEAPPVEVDKSNVEQFLTDHPEAIKAAG